jgi:hypothetical protein
MEGRMKKFCNNETRFILTFKTGTHTLNFEPLKNNQLYLTQNFFLRKHIF